MDMDARSGITYNKLYKMAVQFFIYINVYTRQFVKMVGRKTTINKYIYIKLWTSNILIQKLHNSKSTVRYIVQIYQVAFFLNLERSTKPSFNNSAKYLWLF